MYKLLSIIIIFAVGAFATENCFAADFYNCDGVIQSKPCDDDSEPWLRDVKEPEDKERKVFSRIDAPKVSESPVKEDKKSVLRQKPHVQSKAQKLNTLEWEFSGTVKGQGNIKLSLNFLIDNGSRRVTKQLAASKIVRLPDIEGVQSQFSFRSRPPVSPIWRWEVVAENK